MSVRGNGRGGRNQEFALALLPNLPSGRSIVVASIGTDGIDGPTDAAGAAVSAATLAAASAHGLDPLEYLERNDAYAFFEGAGRASQDWTNRDQCR